MFRALDSQEGRALRKPLGRYGVRLGSGELFMEASLAPTLGRDRLADANRTPRSRVERLQLGELLVLDRTLNFLLRGVGPKLAADTLHPAAEQLPFQVEPPSWRQARGRRGRVQV